MASSSRFDGDQTLTSVPSLGGYSATWPLSADAQAILGQIGHGGTIGFWYEKGVQFSGSTFGLDAAGLLAESFRQRFTYRDTIFRRHQKRFSVIGQESPGMVPLLRYFPFTTIRVLLGGGAVSNDDSAPGVDGGLPSSSSGADPAGGALPPSVSGDIAPARRKRSGAASVPVGIGEDPLAGLCHWTRARASCLWVARGDAKLVLDGGGVFDIQADTIIMLNHLTLTAPYIQLGKDTIAAWAFLLSPEGPEFYQSRRYLKAKERHAQWSASLGTLAYHCRVEAPAPEQETPPPKKGKVEPLQRRISAKTILPPTLHAIESVATEPFHWQSLVHRFIIGDVDQMVATYEWQLDTAEMAGMDQIIWAMASPTEQRVRERWQFAPLAFLLPQEELRYLLDNNVPEQMVKDIVAMRALELYGGLAVDLKMAFVGQGRTTWGALQLPVGGRTASEAAEFPVDGRKVDVAAQFPVDDLTKCFVFTEPVKITSPRCTARALEMPHFDGGKAHGQVWLGVIGGPPAHKMFLHLGQAFHKFWTDWVDRIYSGGRQRVDWSAMAYNEHWMQNTRAVHAAATNSFANSVHMLPPMVACPLPPWMSSPDQLGQSPYGYPIPSAAQLQKDTRCCLVCIWHRQWKEDTKRLLKNFLETWLSHSPQVLSFRELSDCQYRVADVWQNYLESFVFMSLPTHKISLVRAYFYSLTRKHILSRHISQVATWSHTPRDFIVYGAAVVALAAGWPTSISHAESLVRKTCIFTHVSVPNTQAEADELFRVCVAALKEH